MTASPDAAQTDETEQAAVGAAVDAARATLEALEELLPDIDALYRDLHAHPELSGQEERTAKLLAQRLTAAGCEVTTGVGGDGVVGMLRNGEGPVVALRGDMDALPVREETALPYASTVTAQHGDGTWAPVMHACGHDAHTACLAGAVELLARARHRWRGTVLVIGQPAEESVSGAAGMLADGLFTRFPRPDVVLGQHTSPVRAGLLLHRTGPVYAANANLRVRIHGFGGHGARPEVCVDPITIAAYAITRLQTIVSRELSPRTPAVVTVGSFHAGTRPNVIGDVAELELTTRGPDAATVDRLVAAVERIVQAEAAAAQAPRSPEVIVEERTGAVHNDARVVGRIRAVHESLLGAEAVSDLPEPNNSSEDFAEYGAPEAAGPGAEPIPLGFWFFGVTSAAVWEDAPGDTLLERIRAVPGTHTARYAPDPEPTLRRGIQAMTAAALAHLATGER